MGPSRFTAVPLGLLLLAVLCGSALGKTTEIPCCLGQRLFTYDRYHKPVPVFDSLLFPKCPADKSDAAICAAVSALYGVRGTQLFADEHSDYAIDSSRLSDDLLWVSDRYADVAVINSGCCFNLYPVVQPTLRYAATCSNSVLGNVADLGEIFEYSIYAAGSFAKEAESDINYPVIVGGNYKGQTAQTIASTRDTALGSFPNTGFFVGGTIEAVAVAADLTVANGETRVGSDPGDRLTAAYIPVSRAEQAEAIATISAQVCALSKNMQVLEPNALVIVSNEDDEVQIGCPDDSTLCVAEMTSDIFNDPLGGVIRVQNAVDRVVKVNVSGTTIRQSGANFPIDGTPTQIIWNFFEAEAVSMHFVDANTFNNALLAPVARQIDLQMDAETAPFAGSVQAGHPNSHVNVLSEDITTANTISPVDCPVPEPSVTLCNCRCPVTKTHYSSTHYLTH